MDGQSKGDKRDYRPPSQILELTSDPVLLEQLRGKLEEYEKRHEGLVYQPPENPQKREVWLKGHVLGTLLDTGRVDLEEMALKLMHPKDKSGNEIKTGISAQEIVAAFEVISAYNRGVKDKVIGGSLPEVK